MDVSVVAWGLARVSGWYHIHSLAGEVIGQLKVGILDLQLEFCYECLFVCAGECGPMSWC